MAGWESTVSYIQQSGFLVGEVNGREIKPLNSVALAPCSKQLRYSLQPPPLCCDLAHPRKEKEEHSQSSVDGFEMRNIFCFLSLFADVFPTWNLFAKHGALHCECLGWETVQGDHSLFMQSLVQVNR